MAGAAAIPRAVQRGRGRPAAGAAAMTPAQQRRNLAKLQKQKRVDEENQRQLEQEMKEMLHILLEDEQEERGSHDAAHKAALEKAQKERAQLMREKEALKQNAAQLEKIHAQELDAIRQANERALDHLKDKEKEHQRKEANLQSELQKLRGQLEKQGQEYQAALASSAGEKRQLQEQLEKEQKEKSEQIQSLNYGNARLLFLLKQEEKKVKGLQNSLEQSERAVREAKNQHTLSQEQSAQKLEKFAQEMSELKTLTKTLHSKNVSSQRELENFDAKLKKLEKEKDLMDSFDRENFKTSILAQGKISNAEKENQELNEKLESAQAALDNANKELEDNRQGAKRMEQKIKIIEENFNTQVKSHGRELKQKDSLIKDLQEEVRKKNERLEALIAQNVEQEEALNKELRAHNLTQQQKEQIEHELRALSRAHEALEIQLNQSQSLLHQSTELLEKKIEQG